MMQNISNTPSDFAYEFWLKETLKTAIGYHDSIRLRQTQTEFYSTSIEIKSVTSGCKNNMVENKR